MNLSTSEARRDFGDSFIPAIKRLLSLHFYVPADAIDIASFDLDTKQATDLVLPDGTKVAIRTRTAAFRRYRGQFTIRTSSKVNELEKLERGLVDYVFYSFEAARGELAEWWLMRNDPNLLLYPLEDCTNGSDSDFRAFLINRDAVVASGVGRYFKLPKCAA